MVFAGKIEKRFSSYTSQGNNVYSDKTEKDNVKVIK
jgi:hypothetical protein